MAYIASRGTDVEAEVEHLSDTTLYNELLLTRLRTSDGLPLGILATDDRQHLLREAQPHIQRGALSASSDTLRLTRRGLFVSDNIISDFMHLG